MKKTGKRQKGIKLHLRTRTIFYGYNPAKTRNNTCDSNRLWYGV